MRAATKTSITRRWPVLLGGVVCAGLLSTIAVSPTWAQGGGGTPSAVVGDFAIGDGVEGLIDERTGAGTFMLPLAGALAVQWSSGAAHDDRFKIGEGWRWAGLGFIDVDGGVRVFPTSGGMYEMDASKPTGLAGYDGTAVAFAPAPEGETLPARADGRAEARPYAYVMAELGGLRTYYTEAGDAIATIDVHGGRTDYFWEPDHRLTGTVDPLGVRTSVDWNDPKRLRIVSIAGDDGAAQITAELEIGDRSIEALVDPAGGRTTVRYNPDGLIDRVVGPSGAETTVEWWPGDDGVATVQRVLVSDRDTGEELSSRTWEPSAGSSSGWPALASSGTYETVVSDGATRVRSTYATNGLMLERAVEVTEPSGSRVAQQQTYSYPGTDGDRVADPESAPPNWSRPERAVSEYLDPTGGTRAAKAEYAFDELGRTIKQIDADGTVTVTEYDPVDVPQAPLPGGIVPPVIGKPVKETTTTPDGLISETQYELTPDHTAVAAAEVYSGKLDDALTRVSRVEFDVEPDGFVSGKREFPQGGAGEPLLTTYERTHDVAAGTMFLSQTVAAGTEEAVTVSNVTDLLHGQPIEQVDAVGNRTTITYDEAGREVARADASDHTVATSYSTRQRDGVNATSVRGDDDVVVTEERDALGRVVRTTDNVDKGKALEAFERVGETRSYPDPATVVVTDAWGATTTTTRDRQGRPVRIELPDGLVNVAEYDDLGNTVRAGLTPTGRLADAEAVSTQKLNERGAVTEESTVRADDGPTSTAVTTYDGFGRMVAVDNGVSAVRQELDAFGNAEREVFESVNPSNVAVGASALTAERVFDERGNTVRKTVSTDDDSKSGGERTFDRLGRLVERKDQSGQTATWEYTADGLVSTTTNEYGRVTRNSYDPVTRALVESSTESPIGESVATAFEYDEISGAPIATYDPADRASTEISYEHDAWGNLTRVTYPTGKSVAYEYDEHGRKTGMTDVAGNVTRYAFDAFGRPVSAVQTSAPCEGEAAGACRELASIALEYDELGRAVALERGNGVTTRVGFTSLDEIATESVTNAAGEIIAERSYTYDERGNVLTRDETTRGADDVLVEESTTYAYDHLDRLLRSSRTSAVGQEAQTTTETEYTPTAGGDIAHERVAVTTEGAGTTTTSRDFEYSPTGELLAISTNGERLEREYDAAGNLVRDTDGSTYAYNARNQRVQATTATGTTTMSYWADGSRRSLAERVSSTTAEAVTEYYWDDGQLINDLHSTDTASGRWDVAGYLLGGGRHARTVSTGDDAAAEVSYYVNDRHASMTHLTDGTGAITEAYAYTDYGTTLELGHGSADGAGRHHSVSAGSRVGDVTRNPVQFAGELTDPSGEQYLRTRIYAADDLQFTTPDSEHLITRYGFADLNPIVKSDPSGRIAAIDVVPWIALGLGILAGGIGAAAAVTAAATLGVSALGWTGVAAAAVVTGGELYGVAVAAGQLVTSATPQFVSGGAKAFFTSDVATWSALAGSLASMAGSLVLAGKAVGILRSEAWADKLVQRELEAAAESAASRVLGDGLNAAEKRVIANAYASKWDVLDGLSGDELIHSRNAIRTNFRTTQAQHLGGQVEKAVEEGVSSVTVTITDPRQKAMLVAFNEAENLANGMTQTYNEAFMLPLKKKMYDMLVEAKIRDGNRPDGRLLYTHDDFGFTTRVRFVDENGDLLYVEYNSLGRSESKATAPGWQKNLPVKQFNNKRRDLLPEIRFDED